MIGEIRQNFTEAGASVGLILATALVLAFFNSLEGYSLDPVFDQNRLQDSGKL